MLSLPDDWEFSENGLEAIFEHDGQASIRTGLKNLERTGYLKRVRERDQKTGQIGACNWYLYDYPHFDYPHLENPSVDKPSWENPPQSITKQSITKQSTTKEANKKSAEALPSIDAASLETEFDILWKLYPRKEGKSNALKDYTKARRDKKAPVTMEEVKAGIERYNRQIKAQGIERRFIKQGSTWFHQRCWEDEYQEGGNNNGGTTGDYPETRVGNYI
jgi:hypothetical protein